MQDAAKRAGRDIRAIKLITVTKEADSEMMREAIGAGITDVGENRVKDALAKKKVFDSSVLNWHMIGHLQTNKVKEAIKIFTLIHSIDSLRLAYIINKEAGKQNKAQDILLELNISGEGSKFGIKPTELKGILEETKHLRHVKVNGLMTMAPFSDEAENSRQIFKTLRELGEENGLNEFSMGMTQDFEVAIEEGATMVRVGSAIFKGNIK